MLAKPSLTLKRRFKASPEKVYNAWIDPDKIVHWWGPSPDDEVILAEIDARVGGRFHLIFRERDGETNDCSGVYREVVPNEKLVFTWAWRSTPERVSLVTLTFKPDSGQTLMTLLHEQFFDEEARDRHREGWSGALDKLEAMLTA
ncbi:SRPBCC family protein [Marinivivus vitaminiproducens]|uniref:SRPBCC family protein n=1 Tax=Marinivivus vitaminiproducens TaxID=3035935 RepID=UPI0027AA8353|nr:SRPBCC domain-containing protein [Geminicoccaceae bacterium SCSIO 64248]